MLSSHFRTRDPIVESGPGAASAVNGAAQATLDRALELRRQGSGPPLIRARLAEVAGTDVAPREPAPAHPAYWPVLGAFGAGLVVL